jgi:predicted enzyme related to lactoylglutathione lyase
MCARPLMILSRRSRAPHADRAIACESPALRLEKCHKTSPPRAYRGRANQDCCTYDFGSKTGVLRDVGKKGNDTVSLALNRIILYARDVEGAVAFYEKHFGFKALRLPGDRIVELVAQSGGANIMIHPAARGIKTGQANVKLVFDVEDVSAFCERSARDGLLFSPQHPANGYTYANAKDPCGNNVQVTSRAFRKAE